MVCCVSFTRFYLYTYQVIFQVIHSPCESTTQLDLCLHFIRLAIKIMPEDNLKTSGYPPAKVFIYGTINVSGAFSI